MKHCFMARIFVRDGTRNYLGNFIQWISHYPTVSVCAKISVFPRVQANMHTLTTAKFGSVQKPWATFNMKYILDPE